MIDYILSFTTETDAKNFFIKYSEAMINKNIELSSLISLDEDKNYVWDQSRVTPNLEIIDKEEVYNTKINKLISPKVTRPGYYLWISLSKLYDDLIKISLCYGDHQLVSKLAYGYKISPVPMGRTYSWDKV